MENDEMRADGLPDNKSVVDRLASARDAYSNDMPGKPAIELPIESLHFYRDSEGTLKCVLDMEQVIYLADDMLRKSPV